MANWIYKKIFLVFSLSIFYNDREGTPTFTFFTGASVTERITKWLQGPSREQLTG